MAKLIHYGNDILICNEDNVAVALVRPLIPEMQIRIQTNAKAPSNHFPTIHEHLVYRDKRMPTKANMCVTTH